MGNHRSLNFEKNASVGVLTFNRPDVHNALDTESATEALRLMHQIAKDTEIKVLVITGAGESFVAGADIAEMLRKTPEQARVYSELGHTLMNTIANLDRPVIAAINGYCLGGGMEVALASDIRIASEKARFGLPEAILGIIPGWGATQRAARLVGSAITKELIFTGDTINSTRALDMGLVNHVVAQDELVPFTMDMASRICRQSQNAVAHAKKVINDGAGKPLSEACRMETHAFVACFETAEQREGMQAFLEKREPDFNNR